MAAGRSGKGAALVAVLLAATLVAPTVAAPAVAPSLTVVPATDLVTGQSVDVTGTGFSPGKPVGVVQCIAGAFGLSHCDLGELSFATTDGTGGFATEFSVRRLISVGGATVDCSDSPGACVVGSASSSNLNESATAPISFDPDAPLPTEPAATVEPDTGLVDRQVVSVSGGGFLAGRYLRIWQCAASGDPAPCIIMAEGAVTDSEGAFGHEMTVRRGISAGDAGVVDCAAGPGTCEIVVSDPGNLEYAVHVPIAFDPVGPPPAPPSISVTPSSGLADRTDVSVAGAGFESGAYVELMLCEEGTGGYDGYCRPYYDDQAVAGDDGSFEATLLLRRLIDDEDGDPIDCAFESCAVVATAYRSVSERAVAPVTFDPDLPMPDPPVMSVDPDEGLVDGQVVHVEASGFAPGANLSLSQCTQTEDLGLVCRWNTSDSIAADGSGSFSADVEVRRLVASWDDSEPVDCAAAPGTCFVEARSYEEPLDRARVPISFDPEVPPSPPPSLAVDPSSGLADRQEVAVDGDGFAPGDEIYVRECTVDPGYGTACTWASDTPIVAGDDGSVSTTLRVRRTIALDPFGGGEGAATGSSAASSAFEGTATVDCAQEPGTCFVEARSYEELLDRARVPLSFDPEAPPFPPPAVTVDPTTDLVDRQSVHVSGSGFSPGLPLSVAECAVSPDPGYPPNPCRYLRTVTADDRGEIAHDIAVRRMVGSMSHDPVDCAQEPGRCVLRVGPDYVPEDQALIALTFDPDAPFVRPAVTLDPEIGVSDGQVVSVHGTGYTPGAAVGIAQCAADAQSTSGCDLSRIGYATAGASGSFDATFAVSTSITVGGDTVECDAEPGACVVGAANVSDYSEGAKDHLTFGDAPAVSAGAVEVAEGDDGSVTAELPLHLSGASNAPVSVHWEAVAGTAAAIADFGTVEGAASDAGGGGLSGDVTFPAGVVGATVPVTIVGDCIDEDDETVHVVLSGARHASASTEPGIVTIVDDDDPPVVAAGMAGIWEGGRRDETVMRIPVFLSSPSGKRVSVRVRTIGLTARPRHDFVPLDETLVFEPGDLVEHAEIEIVGDRRSEPLELFLVKLSSPQSAEIGGLFGLGFGLVWDDDLHRHDRR